MAEDVRGFKYDVALSFAGEDRNVAEKLATELNANGVRVFYDKWEEANLWGKDLYQHLSEVYGNAARFSVVLISETYAAKAWTNHELRSAQARAFSEHAEYILPVRLDDTDIPGLPRTIGYVDLRRVSVEQLALLLLQKLQFGTGEPYSIHRSNEPRRPTFRIPQLPRANVDHEQDAHSLIEHVARVLDERVPVLRDAGLTVRKETGANGLRIYRVEHKGKLAYFLRMKVGGPLGPTTVSFLDGWNEPPEGDSATAIAVVQRLVNETDPTVSITNFSLLDSAGVSISMSFHQFADGIWEKACRVVEAIVNQRG